MGIVTPQQMGNIKPRSVFVILYGEPGVFKTTIGLTSENPILLDFDKGFDRAGLRQPTLIIDKGWKDVQENEEEIMKYNTIIVDTAKACLDDVLAQFVIGEDSKNKKSNGALSLAGYGALGEAFKTWINKLRLAGKDIVVIAHSKDEKENDTIIKYPDVTGGSYNLLMRMADQVGYVHTVNNKAVIIFTPTDKNQGKDTAKLGTIPVPPLDNPEFLNIMGRIITATKERINDRTKIISAATDAIEDYKLLLAELLQGDKSPEEFEKALAKSKELPLTVQELAKNLFRETLAKSNVEYTKLNGWRYKVINATAEAPAAQPQTAPAAAPSPAPAPAATKHTPATTDGKKVLTVLDPDKNFTPAWMAVLSAIKAGIYETVDQVRGKYNFDADTEKSIVEAIEVAKQTS